jgi:class 3 adenylate cyclase
MDAATSVQGLMSELAGGLKALVPFDLLNCIVLDVGEGASNLIWSSASPRNGEPLSHAPSGVDASTLKALLEADRPRITDDLEEYCRKHPDSESARRLLALGIRSVLTCPLLAMGRSVGVLLFSSRVRRRYLPEHVKAIARLLDQIALVVERILLLDQLDSAKRSLEEQNKLLSRVFRRYTSEDVASHLLRDSTSRELGGVERRVTLLFADVCGFSKLCRSLNAKRVMQVLNVFFTAMTPVIERHGGTIDELIGDSILAVFGAPGELEAHAETAVECARAMRAEMRQVNERLAALRLPGLHVTMAVHTGDVMVGNIGSDTRAKFGMVGSAVNFVARMEGHAAPDQILCSRETMREMGDSFRYDELVWVAPKSSHERVAVFSLPGDSEPGRDRPKIVEERSGPVSGAAFEKQPDSGGSAGSESREGN